MFSPRRFRPASVPELGRRPGVAEKTMDRWNSKFGSMEASEAKESRELVAESARLTRLRAEAKLDEAALRELVEGSRSRLRGGARP
jgi:putative transposase